MEVAEFHSTHLLDRFKQVQSLARTSEAESQATPSQETHHGKSQCSSARHFEKNAVTESIPLTSEEEHRNEKGVIAYGRQFGRPLTESTFSTQLTICSANVRFLGPAELRRSRALGLETNNKIHFLDDAFQNSRLSIVGLKKRNGQGAKQLRHVHLWSSAFWAVGC